MKQLLEDTTKYLKETNNVSYEVFTSIAVTEFWIPETAKPIRKYVLQTHNKLLKANQKIRLLAFPLTKLIPNIKDSDIIAQHRSYFQDEKECLLAMKRLLQSNKQAIEEDISYPIGACCGLFLNAIKETQNENSTRLTTFLRINETMTKGIDAYITEDAITPINNQLIKKMTTSFYKVLDKK